MARTILSFGIILGLGVACAPGRLQDQPSPPAVVTPGTFIPTVAPLPPSPAPRTPTPFPSTGAPRGDITVRAPMQGAEVRSPLRVEGSASVFEGNVQVIIRDGRGEPVGRATATASAGAPERGDFGTTVSFALTGGRQNGVVEVFSPNPRDGSPQNVVRVPVLLLPN